MAEPRQSFHELLERSGKSITRCAFILLYVALVVSSYAILHTTQHIAFGVSLYMVASGVLFGIFVFACTGTTTKLCEWFRFGCSLMLALALTFFILVSGGAAVSVTNPPPSKTSQTAQVDTQEVPLSGLVVNCAIVASIGLFVVIVILLPVLTPMGVSREPDRMTIQMTAVYANFARSGINSNPTLLMANGSGQPGTETLLLYSRVRGQPPTYEESQHRDDLKRANSQKPRRNKNTAKTVLVFPSSSAGNSLERPREPPPTYEELYGRRLAETVNGEVRWSTPHQAISIEGLFPPSYEESVDVEDVEERWQESYMFQPSTSGGDSGRYYVPNTYYVQQTTVARSVAPNNNLMQQDQPQVVPWRTRSFLDSSDTDDTTSRSGTLRRSPCGTLHRPSPTATMQNQQNSSYGNNYAQGSPTFQQPSTSYHNAYYTSQAAPIRSQPTANYASYPRSNTSNPYGSGYPSTRENCYRDQHGNIFGYASQYHQTLPARSASFVDARYPAAPLAPGTADYRSATMRPDWGRYNRIRSFLDSSDTSTEDGSEFHSPTVLSQQRTMAFAGYRTYHHGSRPYTTLRRQYAADYADYQWSMRRTQRASYVGGGYPGIGYYTADRRLPHPARRPVRSASASACGCPHLNGANGTSSAEQESAINIPTTSTATTSSANNAPYCVSSNVSMEMPGT